MSNANLEAANRSLLAEQEERQKAEERLLHAQKMDAIGRLAGGVAHDFNNLLTVIAGYSDLVLSSVDADDPVRPSVHEIRKAADRAGSLTHQLLAFSRKQVLQPTVHRSERRRRRHAEDAAAADRRRRGARDRAVAGAASGARGRGAVAAGHRQSRGERA